MMNMKIARYFRSFTANSTFAPISNNCGSSLTFPIRGIFPFSSHSRSKGGIINTHNGFCATTNRAIKLIVYFGFTWINRQLFSASRALNLNGFVRKTYAIFSEAFITTINMFSLLSTTFCGECLSAIFANKRFNCQCASMLFRMFSGAENIIYSKTINAPTVNKYSFMAKSTITWQKVIDTFRTCFYFMSLDVMAVKVFNNFSASTTA